MQLEWKERAPLFFDLVALSTSIDGSIVDADNNTRNYDIFDSNIIINIDDEEDDFFNND